MAGAADFRRCALQALYQFDAGADTSPDLVRESLQDSATEEHVRERGFALAVNVWRARAEADLAVARLTPDWPTHRQPVIDRNILRMAHWELTAGAAPPKVVINEAVELAREFSTERSPMFVNGVLDKFYKSRAAATEGEAAGTLRP
jgi:N utilization substance protein B